MAKKLSAYKDFSTAPTKGMANSDIIDPYISGYYYLVWIRKPAGIVGDKAGQVPKTFFDDITRVLSSGVTLPGITLNTTDVVTSFSNASKVSTPTSIERDNTLGIKFNEMSGLPIIKNISNWIFSIRDPLTGLSKVANYGIKNISGDLLVILTKPILSSAANAQDEGFIERAYYFTNLFPTNIPDDILSPDLATQDKIEVDIQFKFTNCIISDKVDELAVKQLTGKVFDTVGYNDIVINS